MEIYCVNIIHKGSFISFCEYDFKTTKGRRGKWEAVERNDFKEIVCVFALTKNKEVVLTKSFRVPCGCFVLEWPAGICDVEGESMENVARRELLEETGHIAGKIIKIAKGPFSAGMTSSELTIFFADDCEYCCNPELEEAEEIETVFIPLGSFVDFIIDLWEKPKDGLKVDVKILSMLPVLQRKGFI